MSPTFHRETFSQVVDDIRPLLLDHWKEIAHHRDIPLDPDYGAYARLWDSGRLVIFTVRDGQELIGYSIFFLGHIHYKNSRIAVQDILFVKPERRGGLGYRFIRWCDEQLRDMGVQVVTHHVKIRVVDFSPILRRLGYELMDAVYTRSL